MNRKTWNYPDRHPDFPGPWDGEPDKVQWVDPDTDLDCLIVRNYTGALCGYVGVPPGHPWHGKLYMEIEGDVEVHGGLTFSSLCEEVSEEDMDTVAAICHVPAPGRPAEVWWLGFDCAHSITDVIPRIYQQYPNDFHLGAHETYKDIAYVTGECKFLAAQVKAAA